MNFESSSKHCVLTECSDQNNTNSRMRPKVHRQLNSHSLNQNYQHFQNLLFCNFWELSENKVVGRLLIDNKVWEIYWKWVKNKT